jgi:hypothetical protein
MATTDKFRNNFLSLYQKLHDPQNKYFSKEGIPYHSAETLIVEAPSTGFETTSEALSYYVWLEAVYGRITNDWKPFKKSWDVLERNMIPQRDQQPTNGDYNPQKPASYAPEFETCEQYPSPIDSSVPVGKDPIGAELKSKHGDLIYGMHWLADVDNWYGFGEGKNPTFFNTFQRGASESVWKTIPQPSIEKFEHGGDNGNGFLDLFTQDGSYSKQWRYTVAPDADARAIQAVYWAKKWADEKGGSPIVNDIVKKAAKMGDFLRYCFFDKYFKKIGCQDKNSPGGTSYDSAHYLLSWYYAFGGPVTPNGWAFRIGSSHNHFGYQNPFAAWVLANKSEFNSNMCPNASRDWKKSLKRQLQMYSWLQSAEGAIAGGCTNSWNGRYELPPANVPKFFGMAYQAHPVYLSPPSNGWFGFQSWSMERVAQYYYESKDASILPLLKKWVDWVSKEVKTTSNGIEIPSGLEWSGAPDASWSADAGLPAANKNLHVKVTSYSKDVNIMPSIARTFLYYAAATNDARVQKIAYDILDDVLQQDDNLGFSTDEVRKDYLENFHTSVYVPPGWTGSMPNGDRIDETSTFLSIRSKYKDDPLFPVVQNAIDNGEAPVIRYHRFWGQTEVALAFAVASFIQPWTVVPVPVPSPVTPVVPEAPIPTPVPIPIVPKPVPPPPATVGNVKIDYRVSDKWTANGFQFYKQEVKLTNTGTTPVINKTVAVDCDTVINSWNSTVEPTDSKKFRFPQWLVRSGGLQPGASYEFGYITRGKEPTARLI